MTSENIWRRIPRAVTLCLLIAVGRHLWAAVSISVHSPAYRPLQWLLLALAELALLAVALTFPRYFFLRNMRLVGVAVSANALLILAPLPGLFEIYGNLVPSLMLPALAAGVAVMAAVFFVAMAADNAAGRRPPEGPSRSGSVLRERWVAFGIAGLALAVLPLWIRAGGLPPLLSLITGTSASDLGAGRHAALSNLDSMPLRVTIGMLRNLLLLFAVGWAAANLAQSSKGSWRNHRAAMLTTGALFTVAVAYALFTTERAVIGELIVVAAVAALLASGRELSTRMVVAMVSAAAAFPILVGVLSGAADLTGTLQGLWRRAFYLPADVMVRYFAEFPARTDFLDGASVPKLSYLTGGETFDLSGHIFSTYYLRSGGVEGNANGSFFGVGWANGGFAGVVMWAALAALTLVILDRVLDRYPSRSGAALRSLGVIMAVLTTSTDIFRSILSFAPGYLDLLVVVWCIDAVSRYRSNRSARPRSALPQRPDIASKHETLAGPRLD